MTELPFGDDVLIGYTVEAHFADGTVDTGIILEPQIDFPDGVRATVKLEAWRALYTRLGAVNITVAAEWVPRSQAIREGFIRGA